MPRYGPGPVYVGDAGRAWWLALFGRKNKGKAKPQTKKIRKPRKQKGGGKK